MVFKNKKFSCTVLMFYNFLTFPMVVSRSELLIGIWQNNSYPLLITEYRVSYNILNLFAAFHSWLNWSRTLSVSTSTIKVYAIRYVFYELVVVFKFYYFRPAIPAEHTAGGVWRQHTEGIPARLLHAPGHPHLDAGHGLSYQVATHTSHHMCPEFLLWFQIRVV